MGGRAGTHARGPRRGAWTGPVRLAGALSRAMPAVAPAQGAALGTVYLLQQQQRRQAQAAGNARKLGSQWDSILPHRYLSCMASCLALPCPALPRRLLVTCCPASLATPHAHAHAPPTNLTVSLPARPRALPAVPASPPPPTTVLGVLSRGHHVRPAGPGPGQQHHDAQVRGGRGGEGREGGGRGRPRGQGGEGPCAATGTPPGACSCCQAACMQPLLLTPSDAGADADTPPFHFPPAGAT